MKPADTEKLEQVISPVLIGLGYELVDLEWKSEAGHWVLRVFIDFPESVVKGSLVSHDDCTRASRGLSAELDVADVIPHAFNLEVSSPGLDRPLRRESDFRRFAGRKAKVRTRNPAPGTITERAPGGRKNFAGVIVGAEAGKVRIEVDAQVYELPVTDVEKAHLVFEI